MLFKAATDKHRLRKGILPWVRVKRLLPYSPQDKSCLLLVPSVCSEAGSAQRTCKLQGRNFGPPLQVGGGGHGAKLVAAAM